MKFSDTTTKGGIIQRIEFHTGLGDAGISGNATLLKVITACVNDAFDEIMPLLLSYSDKMRWDDPNNADFPIATFDIASGQADYTFTEDENNLDILNITNVRILESSSGTEFKTLTRMTLDDSRALDALAPNPSVSGIPTHFLEKGTAIFLYPEPNFTKAAGGKIFFEREQSYFASTDTTKEPGIPKPFHPLLSMIASHSWLIVNKPSNTAVITRLEGKIADTKKSLEDAITFQNPTVNRLVGGTQDNK